MVQTTEHWRPNDIAAPLDPSRNWRVAAKRLMSTRFVVIVDILEQGAQQMLLPQRDNVIGALAPDAPDDTLDESVLPW